METIHVSIVEDLNELREGLKAVLNGTIGYVCSSTHHSAEDALTNLLPANPQVVMMDINLPGMSGIECVLKLKAQNPALLFMMFTVYDDDENIFDALKAGASGYILKKTPPAKIIESIRELHEGGSPMSAHIARKVVDNFRRKPDENVSVLSPREHEVLILLSKGFLYKEIAARLFISVATVRQHIHKIYEKLHVHNRTEAINKVFPRA